MSLSSIMSGNDDPPSYKQDSRRSSRATIPAQLDRPSTPTTALAPLAPAPSTPADREQLHKIVNGHKENGIVNGKVRPDPRQLLEEIGAIDAMGDADVVLQDAEAWSVKYKINMTKRILAVEEAETSRRKVCLLYYIFTI